MARAADSSQFDGKFALVIGLMSVWPSILQHPGDIGRDLRLELFQCVGELVDLGRGFGLEIGGA